MERAPIVGEAERLSSCPTHNKAGSRKMQYKQIASCDETTKPNPSSRHKVMRQARLRNGKIQANASQKQANKIGGYIENVVFLSQADAEKID